MAHPLTTPSRRTFRNAIPQTGLLILLLGLLLAIAACQPDGADEHLQFIPTPSEEATSVSSPVVNPSDTPPLRILAKSTPTLQMAILCVPPRWLDAITQSTETLLAGSVAVIAGVVECDDPSAAMAEGRAQLTLVPGDQGALAGSRPIALVVPFGSPQVALTLDEAQHALDEAQYALDQGSSSIQAMDWSDVPQDLTVLRVDGAHPADPNYPLMQHWSVVSAPGYESAAAHLAPALSPIISSDQVAKLVAAGDVMLDRRLGDVIASGWMEYPFENVAGLLSNADLTIGNLESALGNIGEAADKTYTFQAPLEAAQTLEFAGFDLLSLANNHALDFGHQALQQGIELLRVRGISTVGAGVNETAAHTPFITEIDGLKLAFLAYVDVPVEWRGFDAHSWIATPTRAGVAWADPERIRTDVDDAARLADLVIVLLHGGNEFIYEPSTAQVSAAHAAIEAGAHLVLGHHTHVVQGVEFYQGGVIAYGLGNLAFTDSGASNSIILNVWLDAQGVRSLEIVPLTLQSDGRPTPADGARATSIRSLVYELSDDLR
jgi:poly-gamma-glutamate synthesis protein (capsule biosynthesis protein)